MNHKQKLGYMALGAGIMAVGIIIGQVITPDIEAQSNGVFGEIQCTGLTVVDKDGKEAIILVAGKSGNGVYVKNKNGKSAIVLVAIEELSFPIKELNTAIEFGSSINIYDKNGTPAISLSTGGENDMRIYQDR